MTVASSCRQQAQHALTAEACLEAAEAALANNSIRQGETLLRKTIRLASESEDWHTTYIAYLRLASSLSQSNSREALRLTKQALTVYEQHPDDERNQVILLDYAGTYAAQVAFDAEAPFDEALALTRRGDSRLTLTPHEWSEIERTLNAIDNNRFADIREHYPSMQEDDVRLCILTRLGLSNRTIGNIYCITVSAVQHRKLKLKKDVFGETNPDITLEQVLKR